MNVRQIDPTLLILLVVLLLFLGPGLLGRPRRCP